MSNRSMNLIGKLKQIVIYRSDRGVTNSEMYYIMKPLTEEEEKTIDDENVYHYTNKNGDVYKMNKSNIILYGSVDVTNKEDRAMIRQYNLLGDYLYDPCFIPKGLNLRTGDVTYDKVPLNELVTNPIKWFRYCLLRINKPERIIIFKMNKKMVC